MSARDTLIGIVRAWAAANEAAPETPDAVTDAYRAEVIAERDAETIAWLGKKAREYRATGRKQHALQADAVDTMASKLARGAVRANNLLGVVTRADVLAEAADKVIAIRDAVITEPEMTGQYLSGLERAARELRRMADAAGQSAPASYAVGAWTPNGPDRQAPAAPDFFQGGHTYSDSEHTTDWKFRVDTVTTHPQDGKRTALGWRHFRGEWEPYAYDEDDWEIHQLVGHTDITKSGEAR